MPRSDRHRSTAVGVRSGIDEQRVTGRGRDDDRVALPDVAERPLVSRAAARGCEGRVAMPREGAARRERGSQALASAESGPASHQTATTSASRRSRRVYPTASRHAAPGTRADTSSHGDDPRHRAHARQASSWASAGETGADQRRQDTEHGRRGDGGRHQQVRRDRHQADLTCSIDDHRGARQLSGRGYGEGVGQELRQSNAPGRDASRAPPRAALPSPARRARSRTTDPSPDPRAAGRRWRRTAQAPRLRGHPAPEPRRRRHRRPSPGGPRARGGRARGTRARPPARPQERPERASPHQRAASRAAARTIATLAPLTATR